MSPLGTFCKTKSLPFLSKSSHRAVMINDLPLLSYPLFEQTGVRDVRNYHTSIGLRTDSRALEDFFIGSLVAAGACKSHCSRLNKLGTSTQRPKKDTKERTRSYISRRHYGSDTHGLQESLAAPRKWYMKTPYSNSELTDLVNTYPSESDLWHLEDDKEIATKDSLMKPKHFPLAPRMVLPPEKEDAPPYARRIVLPPVDREHADRIRHLEAYLNAKLGRISLNKLWDSYQALQTPRLRYLSDATVRRLFAHFAWVEYKHQQHAHDRFFAFLEECVGEKIPVRADEWNAAIAFAGRQDRGVSTNAVKAAVETWMRMEEHGVAATHGTFNVLFDLAVKAGRFALADTIYHELLSRDMRLNRFFRTSLIHYAGIRGDGDAVRQAFRDLVNAGEIVDTVVMNCVIKSLVNAGEPAAAENVFIKMKRLHEQKLGTKTPTDWQDLKALGHKLDIEAQRLREERTAHESSFFGSEFSSQDRKEEVQRSTPIAPNERTYRIFMNYHAQTTGSIDQIMILLKEMRDCGLNVHGSIYYHIFGGFWQHGGYTVSLWTRKDLEAFWQDFLRGVKRSEQGKDLTGQGSLSSAQDDIALRDELVMTELERPPYFMRDLVVNVLAAFYKCAGRRRMLEVWDEIQRKWKGMSQDERAHIDALVLKFVQEDSIYVT